MFGLSFLIRFYFGLHPTYRTVSSRVLVNLLCRYVLFILKIATFLHYLACMISVNQRKQTSFKKMSLVTPYSPVLKNFHSCFYFNVKYLLPHFICAYTARSTMYNYTHQLQNQMLIFAFRLFKNS